MRLALPSGVVVAACAAWTALMCAQGAPGTVAVTATLVPTCVLRDDACVLLAPAPSVTCERVGDGCALSTVEPAEPPPEPAPPAPAPE